MSVCACMPIINGSRVPNIISVIRLVIKRNGPVRIGFLCECVRRGMVESVCVILIRPQRSDGGRSGNSSSGWPLHGANEV